MALKIASSKKYGGIFGGAYRLVQIKKSLKVKAGLPVCERLMGKFSKTN